MSMVWPTLGSRTAKEQNRIAKNGYLMLDKVWISPWKGRPHCMC